MAVPTCVCPYDITKDLGWNSYQGKITVNFKFLRGTWTPLNVVYEYKNKRGKPRRSVYVFMNQPQPPRLILPMKNGTYIPDAYLASSVINLHQPERFQITPGISVEFEMSGKNLICTYRSNQVEIDPYEGIIRNITQLEADLRSMLTKILEPTALPDRDV